MRKLVAGMVALLGGWPLHAQASLAKPVPGSDRPPALFEFRSTMGIPSLGDCRGQQDAVGFATTADQMARVWQASALEPAPEGFGRLPSPGVGGLICPHDDYLLQVGSTVGSCPS